MSKKSTRANREIKAIQREYGIKRTEAVRLHQRGVAAVRRPADGDTNLAPTMAGAIAAAAYGRAEHVKAIIQVLAHHSGEPDPDALAGFADTALEGMLTRGGFAAVLSETEANPVHYRLHQRTLEDHGYAAALEEELAAAALEVLRPWFQDLFTPDAPKALGDPRAGALNRQPAWWSEGPMARVPSNVGFALDQRVSRNPDEVGDATRTLVEAMRYGTHTVADTILNAPRGSVLADAATLPHHHGPNTGPWEGFAAAYGLLCAHPHGHLGNGYRVVAPDTRLGHALAGARSSGPMIGFTQPDNGRAEAPEV